jgi:hypothetical protein
MEKKTLQDLHTEMANFRILVSHLVTAVEGLNDLIPGTKENAGVKAASTFAVNMALELMTGTPAREAYAVAGRAAMAVVPK